MEISKEQALEAFGLGGKEQKIYLAALELGSATANQIAQKADLNRSTTYDVLKALIERGVCSTVLKKKRTFFEVVPPKRLIAILEEKKQKLSAALQELEAIQEAVVVKPTVELYEGKEGIWTALESLLEERQETLVAGPSSIFGLLSFIIPRFIRRRVQLGIRARVIQEESQATFELIKRKGELREVRYLEKYNPNAAIFIAGKKVLIIRLTEREPLAILIIDENVARSLKEFFEKVWKIAKKR